MRWLIWFVWWRPYFNYRFDRVFGWSRWRALLRCWRTGRRLMYPPHIRKQAERENEAWRRPDEEVHRMISDKLLTDLTRMRDAAIAKKTTEG